jgi:hypothetical protein
MSKKLNRNKLDLWGKKSKSIWIIDCRKYHIKPQTFNQISLLSPRHRTLISLLSIKVCKSQWESKTSQNINPLLLIINLSGSCVLTVKIAWLKPHKFNLTSVTINSSLMKLAWHHKTYILLIVGNLCPYIMKNKMYRWRKVK